jgi:glutathione peroxidase
MLSDFVTMQRPLSKQPAPFSQRISVFASSVALAGAVLLTGCGARTLPTLYDAQVHEARGATTSLGCYRGKVALVVNITSKCGTTPQLKDLEALYQKYKDKGFVVLGFASEDFGAMDTNTDESLVSFCEKKFNVNFPIFSTTQITGRQKHEVFKFLTESSPEQFQAEVGFNFEKFLVDREGQVIGRFGSFTGPMSTRLQKAVEGAINES